MSNIEREREITEEDYEKMIEKYKKKKVTLEKIGNFLYDTIIHGLLRQHSWVKSYTSKEGYYYKYYVKKCVLCGKLKVFHEETGN